MSEILQYKALSNKIEEALKEKVIGDVHVEYAFDPSAFAFYKTIIVAIEDHNVQRWHCKVELVEFIIKDSNEEEQSKFVLNIVNEVLNQYKEYIYKRYFFD